MYKHLKIGRRFERYWGVFERYTQGRSSCNHYLHRATKIIQFLKSLSEMDQSMHTWEKSNTLASIGLQQLDVTPQTKIVARFSNMYVYIYTLLYCSILYYLIIKNLIWYYIIIFIYIMLLVHGERTSLSRVGPYQFCSGGTLDKPSSGYHFRVGPWKVLQPHWLKSQASELSRGRAKRQIGPLSSASMMKIPELTPRTAKLSSPGMKQPSSPMHGSRWYHNISKLQQNITRWSRMWA